MTRMEGRRSSGGDKDGMWLVKQATLRCGFANSDLEDFPRFSPKWRA